MNRTYPSPEPKESFIHRHVVLVVSLTIVFILLFFTVPIFLQQISDIHGYANDMLRIAQQPDVPCWKLQLTVSVAGNGLWVLDPIERNLHEYAQSKIDKGECTK